MQLWTNAVAGAVLLLLGLSVGPAAAATLTGEVTYRERIALPPGASLRVKLIDMTAPGTPTRVEAEAAIASPGQVPLIFTLNFDDRVIDADTDYALVAEISVASELWFRNAQPYAVNPLAPVAPIAIMTNFAGRLAASGSPADDAGDGPPAAADPDASIFGVTWRALTIRGEPVAEGVESTLSVANDLRAGGRGGCNNYFAQAEISGETIAFSAVGATMMLCGSDAKDRQERAFFAAIETARFWRIVNGELLLLDVGGAELVRFEAAVR